MTKIYSNTCLYKICLAEITYLKIKWKRNNIPRKGIPFASVNHCRKWMSSVGSASAYVNITNSTELHRLRHERLPNNYDGHRLRRKHTQVCRNCPLSKCIILGIQKSTTLKFCWNSNVKLFFSRILIPGIRIPGTEPNEHRSQRLRNGCKNHYYIIY